MVVEIIVGMYVGICLGSLTLVGGMILVDDVQRWRWARAALRGSGMPVARALPPPCPATALPACRCDECEEQWARFAEDVANGY